MMGRIELKTVNALLGYCRDMLLSFDHIESDEDDEGQASFCGWEIGLRRLEAASCDPDSGPITAHGEKKKSSVDFRVQDCSPRAKRPLSVKMSIRATRPLASARMPPIWMREQPARFSAFRTSLARQQSSHREDEKTTHFGFQQVPEAAKQSRGLSQSLSELAL